jgi:hypothetical protein
LTPLSESDEQIIGYLLDELAADDRQQIEERLFREPAFFERVSAVEDDLIMQYVRGDLQGDLLHRFTEVYLGSEAKRKRVDSAQALQQAVREIGKTQAKVAPRSWRLRLALSAAAMVLLAVMWPLLRRPAPGSGHASPQAPEVAFSLDPGLVRGSGGVSIRVPMGTRVRFHLALPDGSTSTSYHAIVGTPEHQNIWNGVATVEGSGLVTVVPADVLNPGDYTLQLEATVSGIPENVSTYYFRVER